MKKSRIMAVCLMSALMLSAVSCGADADNGADTSSSKSTAETTEAPTEAEEATEAPKEAEAATEAAEVNEEPETQASEDEAAVAGEVGAMTFSSGVWEGPDCLYYFDEDGVSGRTSSYQTKTGVPFTYEMDAEGNAVFHMGSADDNTKATVTIGDGNSYNSYNSAAFILWENDTETRLNYYLEATEYNFENFYDDSQLVEKVKAFYTREKGVEPSNVEISGNNGVYAPVDVYVDGAYATSYAVNRFTLYAYDTVTNEEYRSIEAE